MQISVETTQGLERKMTIEIPAKLVEDEVKKRLQQLAKTQRMPGFRPGKVPLSFIQKRFGKAVRAEVEAEVMRRSFFEAAVQEKINPAGAPRVEPLESEAGDQFKFAAYFEVYPEIEVQDFSQLEFEKPVAEVTEEDVDNMLEILRKQRATWEPVRRMARKGDQVVIDFRGTIDGEPFEGGEAKDFPVVLGEGKMLDDFENGLLKIKKGEERDIEVSFPEDYHNKELAGKTAVFHVVAKAVNGQKLPELDEAFVKQFGLEEGTVEALRAEVRKNMERELRQALRNQIKTAVFDALAEAYDFELPKALIDQEIDVLRQQMMQRLGANAGQQLPELPADLFEEEARKRVKLGLLLSELIKKHDIKADEEKIKELVEEMASAYDDPEGVVNWYMADKRRLAEFEGLVLENQVVDQILSEAKVKEVKKTFDEVMNPGKN